MATESAWSATASQYKTGSHIPDHFSQVAARILLDEYHRNQTIIHSEGDNHADISHPISLIDVAAGPGTFTMKFINQFSAVAESKVMQHSSFHVTDFASGMIDMAKNIFSNEEYSNFKISCEQMSAEALVYPDEMFDLCGCMFGVMFFPDRAKGISEMNRVLKQGGIAVIGTWFEVSFFKIIHEFCKFLKIDEEEGFRLCSEQVAICAEPKIFEEELLRANFKDIRISQETESFHINNKDVFDLITQNAVMKIAFRSRSDVLITEWEQFLDSKVLPTDILPSREVPMIIKMTANLAFARK